MKLENWAFRIGIFATLTLYSSVEVAGQFKYETLGNSDGLSQGYVSHLFQDSDGFLWISTKDGLNRYDGNGFRTFTHDAHDPHSISSNTINLLMEDSKGWLWMGTEDKGICVYDKKRNIFKSIMHDPHRANSISGNRATVEIVELEDGRFVTATTERSLNIITIPDDFFENETTPEIKEMFAPTKVEHIYKDAKNRIWVTGDVVYELLPDKGILEKRNDLHYNQTINNADGSVWANDALFSQLDGQERYPLFTRDIVGGEGRFILRETNGRFWISIPNLAKLLTFDTKQWKRGQPIDPDESLIAADYNVGAMRMLQDRTGLLWVGTNGHGLRKYTFESEKFNHKAKGMSIRRILPCNDEKIFIRGWKENKLLSLNGTCSNSELLPGRIHDYMIARSGDMWILDYSDARDGMPKISSVKCINPVSKQARRYPIDLEFLYDGIEPMMEDRNGNIWICGLRGKFCVIEPKTGATRHYDIDTDASRLLLQNALITALYEDDGGTVWMGTEEGLVCIESKSILQFPPQIRWYKNKEGDPHALNYNLVSCIIDDPKDKNVLWVATKGGGLNRLDKTTGKFLHITKLQGLCNNVVYGLLPDADGNIWGSTNMGIFCLLNKKKDHNATWEFRHFTKQAGLQDDEFNTWAYAKMPNGDLAFGGVNGLNIFNPKKILVDSFSPNVFITNLLIGNKPVFPGDSSKILRNAIEYTSSITLNHLQDVFTLEFSSLDFRAPDQIKYRYQMSGIDKEWIESGNRRSVTYSHLPPGQYTFQVQGSNSLGIWSDKTTELQIHILPPWWKTWWASMAYLMVAGFLLLYYFQNRLNKTKIEAQLTFEKREAQKIKELDVIKTQLYTNITHEFRTPLTVILGMVQQIRSNTGEQLENGLNMIERNGKSLLKLVNEMLDLSKLEAGKMELNPVSGDVIQFLRYVVESFHSLAESQHKQLHYLSSLDLLYTEYDAEKLQQILSNLLSNALKFTEEKGNIYISISMDKTGDQNVQLVIRIKDTGIGISEDKIMHVFDRFYQADKSHTRSAEGTGIGLALTKQLVLLMSGSIEVKSPPVGARKGTEFMVSLPMKGLNYEEPTAVHAPSILEKVPAPPSPVLVSSTITEPTPKDEGAGVLILLVEDNADVVAYTASCLPEYRLAVGKDGKEGFEIACDKTPDLIITDVMMPYVDGFEMCKRLRLDVRTSHIPIIMLTAKADMESKLEGLEHGADAYLEKPFYKEELKLRIKKLLEQRKHLQRVYSGLAGFHNALPSPDNRPADGLSMAVEMPEIEGTFVRKIREQIECHLGDELYGVEQLARDVFMSYSQLHRKTVALTGHSPQQFIRNIRLQKAMDLLTNTDDAIANISAICGFSDASYFGKVFKKELGMTPQAWRRRL
jgi:signal transduction histidine kinase/CheY-like chemotaxis protein/AraC-like DNA-binding protein/ligand-binding sensor domain-containing protein